ncbi:MAG: roadblock/LC7 domain-containing protein [Verrucomicrobia bacterium]|nr:roadblock/LC7 domain-containing protein [Verrucomicrobiota bacterium]
MFSKLKNFFSKIGGTETPPASIEVADASSVATTSTTNHPQVLPAAHRPARPTAPVLAAPVGGGEAVPITWESILTRLPEQLKLHVSNPDRARGTIAVPAQRINEQLRNGAIRIPFGELRRAAPPGMFAPSNAADMTLIELPMKEILSRLQPAYWARRPNQKRITVPDDVLPIFGPDGKAAAKLSERSHSLASAAPAVPGTPAAPANLIPAPASGAGHTTRFTKAATSAPAKPSHAGHTTSFFKPTTSASPVTTSASATTPSSSSGHTTRFFRADQLAAAKTAASPTEHKPVPAGDALEIKLQLLAADWPEPVGQEIVQDGLGQTQVHLPFAEIESGLKRGKILVSWKQIRSWIAAPLPLGPSPLDDIPLELPLNVVVPLFLAQKNHARERKSVAVAENIPDIFSGGSATAPGTSEPNGQASGASLAAADPNHTAPATAPAANETKPTGAAGLSQIFELPDKRNWTPVEVVQRTSSLPGVAGAVIALQDGLLVAGELPNGMSAETVAAFLAPMFSKLTQYAKEMSLGELSQLEIVAGQLPLRIFKAGKIYFGVLGRAGHQLPLAKLSAIATEFGRNLK